MLLEYCHCYVREIPWVVYIIIANPILSRRKYTPYSRTHTPYYTTYTPYHRKCVHKSKVCTLF